MKKILSLIIAMTAMLGVSAQDPSQPEHYEYNVFYYQRATLFDLLPIEPTDIVMLGNSLTNGCEWHELLGLPNVKNRGISSDVIQGVADRMQPIINGQPAKIFLLTGVNDVSHNLGVDSISGAYGRLIDMIRTQCPNTKLYVESMLPINISYGMYSRMADKEQQIRDINDRLAAMAEEKGFTWIDLYPHFMDSEGHMRKEFTNDGLHLLGPGYIQWRDVIMPYVLE